MTEITEEKTTNTELTEVEKTIEEQHISFSEMKTYIDCPFKHNILYKKKLSSPNKTVFTEFGKAVHSSLEYFYDKTIENKKSVAECFEENCRNLFAELPISDFKPPTEEGKNKSLEIFLDQGRNILLEFFDSIHKVFGNFEVIAMEERIKEPFENKHNKKFKGFIDMIIKLEDETYVIIDLKTTSWGWDLKKRTDKLTTYQLTFYKNFFSQKYNIPLDKIKTFFILLKRTVKKDRIEIFEVPCGERKIKNSLELLAKTTDQIESCPPMKNRASCKPEGGFACPFYKTEFCTG